MWKSHLRTRLFVDVPILDSKTQQAGQAASHYSTKQGWYHRHGYALSFIKCRLWRYLFALFPWLTERVSALTFFLQVERWGLVDRLVKSDILGCFDNINHRLLIEVLQSVRSENQGFCDLISAFQKTPIFDNEGNVIIHSRLRAYRKVAPLSPVLMNIFLHQHDVTTAFMNQEKSLYYVRYADDMIFAIKREEKRKQNFQKALQELQLEATFLSFIRGESQPCGTRVLGLPVPANPSLSLEVS